MKSFPKISIVTPSFNQASFIESTIQSVLSQNYPNLEYIIIDGGSTDNSVEIIKKYEKHLHFWCSEPDAGQYDAINKGFSHATGEIMAWLNSDDMYFPWAFRTISSVMTALPQVEWLTTLNAGIWDWHGFCTKISYMPGYSREAFLDGCYLAWNRKAFGWIQQESTFWRRSLWEKAGGYVSSEFKLAGDFDLWTRFYRYSELFGIDSPLGGFRLQESQRSCQIELYAKEAEQSLQQIQNAFNHKTGFSRKSIPQLKLGRLSKIASFFLSSHYYSGKRVIRKKQNSPNSFWEIEEYSFNSPE